MFFLSCLCGSEHAYWGTDCFHKFLSCLCGSELDGEDIDWDMDVSELPVRQRTS